MANLYIIDFLTCIRAEFNLYRKLRPKIWLQLFIYSIYRPPPHDIYTWLNKRNELFVTKLTVIKI